MQAKALRLTERKQQILEAVNQVIHKKSYAAAIEDSEPEYHGRELQRKEIMNECKRQEAKFKFLGILSCAIVIFLIVMICIDLMR